MNHGKRTATLLAAATVFTLALSLGLATAVIAQNVSSISGQVIDPEGKPWPGLIVKFKSDRGQSAETKTDEEGKFTQRGLAAGKWNYEIYNGADKIWDGAIERLVTGEDRVVPVVNYKALIEADPKRAAERKKQEEEKAEFEDMKARFDAGVLAMQTADDLKSTLAKAPADQKAVLQEKIASHRQAAIDDFTAATRGMTEKDPNFALIISNLGAAYKAAGKYEEAIGAYTRAIAVKPDPAYYVGLAESQASTNKNAEALASCGTIPVATHAGNAATCYRNLGIVFYNTNKFQEAVEPLQKATQLEPKNAQAWYVLGASLVPLADFKEEKGKLTMTPKPGTLEAYQKAIELDPNGPYGAQAKDGLAQLEQMGAGISTSIKAGKKKN